MFVLNTPLIRLLRRLIAAGSVALVLTLSVLAVSPEAHEHIHHDAGDEDHACAVVLFAHGITNALDVVAVQAPVTAWIPLAPAARTVLFLTSPRYLHQPGRGPPAN